MAAAKSTRRKGGRDDPDTSYALRERIEAERRRLQKASAVLAALAYSLNHEALDNDQAGDIAGAALDLIEQAILALDAVALKKDATAQPSA